MIHFNDVSKSYESGHDVLAHVSFHLSPGEMAFLTGPSGSGKTTLLQLILAFQKPTRGQVLLNGKDITQLSQPQLSSLRQTSGVMWQEPRLLPAQTVFDNVALPLLLTGKTSRAIQKRVQEILDKVGLTGYTKYYPTQLSLAQQRRVSLARAIVHEPALVLADEPTAHFDLKQAIGITELLAELNRGGTTLLIATHDLGLIASMPHRILTLKQSKLVNSDISQACSKTNVEQCL
ncbi:MAG: ATP-binding cassette domain-containing protein [Gammaproteobacteria bacterium]